MHAFKLVHPRMGSELENPALIIQKNRFSYRTNYRQLMNFIKDFSDGEFEPKNFRDYTPLIQENLRVCASNFANEKLPMFARTIINYMAINWGKKPNAIITPYKNTRLPNPDMIENDLKYPKFISSNNDFAGVYLNTQLAVFCVYSSLWDYISRQVCEDIQPDFGAAVRETILNI